MLVDTHAHLFFDSFNEDIDQVIGRAMGSGVKQIVVPATEMGNIEAVLRLAERFDGVFAAVGVHPTATADFQPSQLQKIQSYAQAPKVVAIGEIGLDYYWDSSPKEKQHEAFRGQLALASELDLPVIIHNRESSEDVVRLLGESDLVGQRPCRRCPFLFCTMGDCQSPLGYGLLFRLHRPSYL